MSELSFAQLTTMRVGGSAEKFIEATDKEQLIAIVNDLLGFDDPWIVLGGGSNTIVRDEGFAGTVVLIRTNGISEIVTETATENTTETATENAAGNSVRLRVEAGHDWDTLVAQTLERGLLGLEALSGIPGAAGAAPIQNIGAYGAELADVLHSIEFLNFDTGEVEQIAAADLKLGYRDSAIKQLELQGVVLSIDLMLERGSMQDPAGVQIKHEQLARALDTEVGQRVSAQQVRETVLQLRRSKGMVLDEDDRDSWSSGSFFVNPIVSATFARNLPKDAPKFDVVKTEKKSQVFPLEKIHLVDEIAHHVEQPEERQMKISAAWLIENSGISRGFRLPGSGAAISDKHTLAITNRGAATASDVAELARYVIARVRSEFGVLLVPEPNLYGIEL